MKILILADCFVPEINAQAIRVYENSLKWTSLGHKVTILTCNPNFPSGKIYSGYKNSLYSIEYLKGIKVIRLWSFMAANDGFLLRTLDFISFSMMALLASFFIKKPDILIGTSPQFFTVISTFLISKFKRVPWVFELRDLWPDSIYALGFMDKKNIFFKLLKTIEINLYKDANCIIAVTQSFKKYLIKLGIDPKKIEVITNGINANLIKPINKNKNLISQFRLKNKFILGYFGTHGYSQNLLTVLKSVKILNSKGFNNKLIFFFIGSGAEKTKLIYFKEKHRLNNVIFLNELSRKKIIQYFSILNVSIIHLKKIKLFTEVIPSKLFDSIGMNIPILLGVKGEAKKIVTQGKVGLYFKPENHYDLAGKILRIYNDRILLNYYKKNAKIISKKFDRDLLAIKMINFIIKRCC